MSDIQEEQKRLYKRAEEIDKEQEINNKFSRIVREKMKNKSAVEMIVLQDEEIKELQNRINKAIEYIEKYCEDYVVEDSPDEMCLFYGEDGRYKPEAKKELLDILQGKE